MGLLDKNGDATVLPFVHEDGMSNTSTVNSTVNMREDDDEKPNEENSDETKSVSGSTKGEDVESPTDGGDKADRPSSASSKVEADTLIDAELNE